MTTTTTTTTTKANTTTTKAPTVKAPTVAPSVPTVKASTVTTSKAYTLLVDIILNAARLNKQNSEHVFMTSYKKEDVASFDVDETGMMTLTITLPYRTKRQMTWGFATLTFMATFDREVYAIVTKAVTR